MDDSVIEDFAVMCYQEDYREYYYYNVSLHLLILLYEDTYTENSC